MPRKRWTIGVVMVFRWKGKTFNAEKTDYYNLPWEKEAYRLQDKYANMVWNEEII